jgi:tRNA G46 methylase TrmB
MRFSGILPRCSNAAGKRLSTNPAPATTARHAESMERWRRAASGAPLILDAGCGSGEGCFALAARFPDHYVLGVD